MTDAITFTLDGREVEAQPGETIWQVASARAPTSRICAGCPSPATGPMATAAPAWSRSRASACSRRPASASRRAGMKVVTASDRAKTARRMVMELLLADQPERDGRAPSRLQALAVGGSDGRAQLALSRSARPPAPDRSHPAMAVHLDACIHCNLCVRACREVQVNDVIGMAYRNARRQDRVRHGRPDGGQHLRRLRRVRAGLPHRRADAVLDDRRGGRRPSRGRPAGRERLPVLRRRLPDHLPHQGRPDPLRDRAQRPGQREPAVRQGPLRLRLRRPSAPPDQAADPQGRRRQGGRRRHRPGQSATATSARRAGRRRWTSPPGACARSAIATARARSPASARPRARTRRPIWSRS